jgi:hypothetical protein
MPQKGGTTSHVSGHNGLPVSTRVTLIKRLVDTEAVPMISKICFALTLAASALVSVSAVSPIFKSHPTLTLLHQHD